jgi:hypothetical protein
MGKIVSEQKALVFKWFDNHPNKKYLEACKAFTDFSENTLRKYYYQWKHALVSTSETKTTKVTAKVTKKSQKVTTDNLDDLDGLPSKIKEAIKIIKLLKSMDVDPSDLKYIETIVEESQVSESDLKSLRLKPTSDLISLIKPNANWQPEPSVLKNGQKHSVLITTEKSGK